ncbi:unnamed protein product, partial [Candidula unifasciata]
NNSTMETMEMKDIQLSEPMGISNSQSFNLEFDDNTSDSPGYRVALPQSR